MASGYTCDICGEAEATHSVTDFDAGETKFVDVGCFARLGLELAKAVLPAEEILAAVGPIHVARQGGGETAGGGRGKGKRPAVQEPESEPDPGQAAGLEESAAAAHNG